MRADWNARLGARVAACAYARLLRALAAGGGAAGSSLAALPAALRDDPAAHAALVHSLLPPDGGDGGGASAGLTRGVRRLAVGGSEPDRFVLFCVA